MKIEIARVPPEGVEVELEEPAAAMDYHGAAARFDAPVRVRARVEVINRVCVVTGSYSTVATVQCARCLRTFEQPLRNGEFRVGHDLEEEEMAEIDLTEEVREDILLSLPYRFLCRDDCRGLCPRCGADLNEGACGCGPERPASPFGTLNLG